MRRALQLFALAILATACGSDESLSPREIALRQAQARWTDAGLANYTLLQRRECFCVARGRDHRVVVENGVIVRVEAVDTGERLPADQHTLFLTVPGLFDVVRGALTQGGLVREVTYDPVRGIPTLISLDPVPQAVDDEMVWHTRLVPAS